MGWISSNKKVSQEWEASLVHWTFQLLYNNLKPFNSVVICFASEKVKDYKIRCTWYFAMKLKWNKREIWSSEKFITIFLLCTHGLCQNSEMFAFILGLVFRNFVINTVLHLVQPRHGEKAEWSEVASLSGVYIVEMNFKLKFISN